MNRNKNRSFQKVKLQHLYFCFFFGCLVLFFLYYLYQIRFSRMVCEDGKLYQYTRGTRNLIANNCEFCDTSSYQMVAVDAFGNQTYNNKRLCGFSKIICSTEATKSRIKKIQILGNYMFQTTDDIWPKFSEFSNLADNICKESSIIDMNIISNFCSSLQMLRNLSPEIKNFAKIYSQEYTVYMQMSWFIQIMNKIETEILDIFRIVINR